jgi:pilus assembly protein CpaB
MDRQKALLIFGAAWLSAAVLTWVLYKSTKTPQVAKTVAIQAAARDMPAGTRLEKADLKTVRYAEKDVPKTAILDEKQALDRPLLFPVSANEAITSTKIATTTGASGLAATIEVGKRAISVPINDSSGVSGLIQPRAHVDVLFSKTGSMAEAVTTTILENVEVLAIGRTTEAASSAAAATAAAVAANQTATRAPTPAATVATLLVSPEEARKLEFAKNQGKISLTLRNPLDHNALADNRPTTGESLYVGATRPKESALRTVRVEPPVERQEPLKKQEPPKPHNVIDVFRGDKHVQEIFQ